MTLVAAACGDSETTEPTTLAPSTTQPTTTSTTTAPTTTAPPVVTTTTEAPGAEFVGKVVTTRNVDPELGILGYYARGEAMNLFASLSVCTTEEDCTREVALVRAEPDLRYLYTGEWDGWVWLLEAVGEIGSDRHRILAAQPVTVPDGRGTMAVLTGCEGGRYAARLDFTDDGPVIVTAWRFGADSLDAVDPATMVCPDLEPRAVDSNGVGLLYVTMPYFVAPREADRFRMIDLTSAEPTAVDWWAHGGTYWHDEVGEPWAWWVGLAGTSHRAESPSRRSLWLKTAVGWDEAGQAIFRVHAVQEVEVPAGHGVEMSCWMIGEHTPVIALVRLGVEVLEPIRAWVPNLDDPSWGEIDGALVECEIVGC
jgi:hypothetical protein